MRTRNKKWTDYGLTYEDVGRLRSECLNAAGKDYERICKAAEEANVEMSEYIVKSLTDGLSYERMSRETYIPINRNDFYAYQRKTLAIYGGRDA